MSKAIQSAVTPHPASFPQIGTNPVELPLELWSRIFTYLSNDNSKLRLVCKQWNALISEVPEIANTIFEKTFGYKHDLKKGPASEQMKSMLFNLTHSCGSTKSAIVSTLNYCHRYKYYVEGRRLVAINPESKSFITWADVEDFSKFTVAGYNCPETTFTEVGMHPVADPTISTEKFQIVNPKECFGITSSGKFVTINVDSPQQSKILYPLHFGVKLFHVNGDRVAFVTPKDVCYVLDYLTGKLVNEFQFPISVTAIHMDTSSNRVFIGDQLGRIQVWKLNENNKLLLDENNQNNTILDLSLQGNLLVASVKYTGITSKVVIISAFNLKTLCKINIEYVINISLQGNHLISVSGFFNMMKLRDYDFSLSNAEYFNECTLGSSLNPNADAKKNKEILDRFSQLPQEDIIAILSLFRKDLGLSPDSDVKFEGADSIAALLGACKLYFKKLT